MARREFDEFEAVSAMVPSPEGYDAAIAVKPLHFAGSPTFHKVLAGQKFKTALEADQAANQQLARLIGVDAEGQLVFPASN
ncbi:hypothetical protein M2401_000219 [Pseudomonas sp. JUb42]|jgi:hypothetical protein|uniref:hypothetical protein n=1 Tax=Pseudomonas sp. JUb42 TaxID=2940611 RepID=UPI0021682EC6|nr:hypothetical protein [Pseudomonas sp. JUb42]MCS3466509.1 hypothetical protein [Pseudomonas sp. JUb42]